ncbi:MAG: hypothetical protein V3V08_02405 [Nannocystaceae bacterium]
MHLRTLRCEWLPAPTPTRKLIVVLHGRGDSSAGFRWLPGALALRGLNFLLVNAPDLDFVGYSWYDVAPRQAPGVERSRARLERLFLEIQHHGYSAEDTVLFGFSQGCLMALEWGGRTTLPLAGYVGVSGYCLDTDALLADLSEQARRPVWLVTHGRHDEMLPLSITEAQMFELRAGGWPIRFETYDKAHAVDGFCELPAIARFVAERLGLDRPWSSPPSRSG